MRRTWLLVFPLLLPLVYAEFSGTINISTLSDFPPVTGLFGYTVRHCDINPQCFGYNCFLDYDSEVDDSDTSLPAGICNATAVTQCFHDGKWYVSGTNICNSNVTYRTCLTNETGKWSGLNNCASGETCSASADNPGNCTAPGSSSSSGGGGGSADSRKHSVRLVSRIPDFDVIQGESAVQPAKFRNDGNLTLTNITLALSGITESWYGVNPARFLSVNPAKDEQFNVTFFVPADAEVRSYSISAEIRTHKSDVSAAFSFSLKVLPSNETVEASVVPKYGELLKALDALQQNVTLLASQGIDEGNRTALNNLAETIRSRLNEANQSLEKKDYFSANTLLGEAETLLGDLRNMLATAKPAPLAVDILMITIAAFAAIIVLFLAYLLWPKKTPVKKE